VLYFFFRGGCFGVVELLLEAVKKARIFRRNKVSLHHKVGAYLLYMFGLSVRCVSEFGVPAGREAVRR